MQSVAIFNDSIFATEASGQIMSKCGFTLEMLQEAIHKVRKLQDELDEKMCRLPVFWAVRARDITYIQPSGGNAVELHPFAGGLYGMSLLSTDIEDWLLVENAAHTRRMTSQDRKIWYRLALNQLRELVKKELCDG